MSGRNRDGSRAGRLRSVDDGDDDDDHNGDDEYDDDDEQNSSVVDVMFGGEHVTMNAVCLHPRWLR